MKKIKFGFVLILSICMFAFISCDNEPIEGEFGVDNGNNNGTGSGTENQTGSFRVDFDSQTFVADIISASRTDDLINITGFRGTNQESVNLTINATTTGTFPIGVTTGVNVNAATYSEFNGSSNVWVALTDGIESQGEVTIIEIDETNLTVTGTFNFTGFNTSGESKVFTNGIFISVSFN